MSDLKPCPHCGGKGMIKRGKTVMVSCLECSASTFQVLDDPESAIAAWNRRTAPQASESTTGNKVLDDQVAAWARERARLDDLIAHATGSVTGSDADKLRRLREGMDKWGWCAEFGALAMEVLREPSAPVGAVAAAVDRQSCLLVADDILKLYFLPITGYVLKQKIADAVYDAIKNNPCAADVPALPVAAQQQAATVPDDATLYRELIYAVGRKYPGESRHQTALRYIVSAERIGHGAAATTDGRDEG